MQKAVIAQVIVDIVDRDRKSDASPKLLDVSLRGGTCNAQDVNNLGVRLWCASRGRRLLFYPHPFRQPLHIEKQALLVVSRVDDVAERIAKAENKQSHSVGS
jgi:hypothetical protein